MQNRTKIHFPRPSVFTIRRCFCNRPQSARPDRRQQSHSAQHQACFGAHQRSAGFSHPAHHCVRWCPGRYPRSCQRGNFCRVHQTLRITPANRASGPRSSHRVIPGPYGGLQNTRLPPQSQKSVANPSSLPSNGHGSKSKWNSRSRASYISAGVAHRSEALLKCTFIAGSSPTSACAESAFPRR